MAVKFTVALVSLATASLLAYRRANKLGVPAATIT